MAQQYPIIMASYCQDEDFMRKRSTPFIRHIDHFETTNDPETIHDDMHTHQMEWKVENGFGFLTHIPSTRSLTVRATESMTVAYKRYLIQKLLSKINRSPLIHV